MDMQWRLCMKFLLFHFLFSREGLSKKPCNNVTFEGRLALCFTLWSCLGSLENLAFPDLLLRSCLHARTYALLFSEIYACLSHTEDIYIYIETGFNGKKKLFLFLDFLDRLKNLYHLHFWSYRCC